MLHTLQASPVFILCYESHDQVLNSKSILKAVFQTPSLFSIHYIHTNDPVSSSVLKSMSQFIVEHVILILFIVSYFGYATMKGKTPLMLYFQKGSTGKIETA